MKAFFANCGYDDLAKISRDGKLMRKKTSIKSIYINIVFPIYILSNLLTSSMLAYAPVGETNTLRTALKYIRYVIYIISIFYSCRTHFKKHYLLYATTISVVVLTSLIVNHNVQVLCSLFVFFALMEYTWEDIISRHFRCLIVTLIGVVALSQIGIIEDFVRDDGRTRHFLGFNWATYSSIICFFSTLCYFCLKKGNVRFLFAMVFLAMATYLYEMTDTRLAYILTLMVIAFMLIYKYCSKHKKAFKRITVLTILSPFICAVISIMIHVLYNPSIPILYKINKLLSQRLYFGQRGIIDYGIKLIGGQVIEWQGFDMTNWTFDNYNYVDCSYLHILLEYGLVFLVVFCVLLTLGIRLAYKKGEYYLCWAVAFVCVLGMMETWLLNFVFNPFLWCGISLFKFSSRAQSISEYQVQSIIHSISDS